MFGQFGQLAGLLKNAGKISATMKEMNERLAAARYVGEGGAGQVTATVDGRGDLVALKIAPALIESMDAEMIEDLVVAAARDAVARSREAMQSEMSAMRARGPPPCRCRAVPCRRPWPPAGPGSRPGPGAGPGPPGPPRRSARRA